MIVLEAFSNFEIALVVKLYALETMIIFYPETMKSQTQKDIQKAYKMTKCLWVDKMLPIQISFVEKKLYTSL